MTLSESEVSTSIEHLRDRNLVYVFYGSTSRVPKYKHMLPTYYELEPAEVAVMAVLMLRGPQTLGELRERASRMQTFSGLDEVQQNAQRPRDTRGPARAPTRPPSRPKGRPLRPPP